MSDTLLILGASGYMGSAFVAECERRGIAHYRANRDKHEYHIPNRFESLLNETKPSLVINCAAFIPIPSVDLCKEHRLVSYDSNGLMPGRLACACDLAGVPLMHLSTGCLFDEQREYSEDEQPTRNLKGYCGVYLQDKISGEYGVGLYEKHYILRLRLPFDEVDHPRNYLTKLAGFSKVWFHVNSLSHRADFVKAALDLWNLKAPWGTYHVVNLGFVSSSLICTSMHAMGLLGEVEFEKNETTGCKLSTKKLTDAGVKIRDVHEALSDAVRNWKRCTAS